MCECVYPFEALRLLCVLAVDAVVVLVACARVCVCVCVCVLFYREQPACQFKAIVSSMRRHESNTHHVQPEDHRAKWRKIHQHKQIKLTFILEFVKSSAPTCQGLLRAWIQLTSRGRREVYCCVMLIPK